LSITELHSFCKYQPIFAAEELREQFRSALRAVAMPTLTGRPGLNLTCCSFLHFFPPPISFFLPTLLRPSRLHCMYLTRLNLLKPNITKENNPLVVEFLHRKKPLLSVLGKVAPTIFLKAKSISVETQVEE
jgi:hypothetical protein